MFKLKWIFSALLLVAFSHSTYAQGYRFGQDGRDGRDGAAGTSGRSGDDVTVFAGGQPYNFILSGEDGLDTRARGEDGENAWSCNPGYNPEYDLRGADGGNGGRGGVGGNGGNGGDITVYYLNEANLKKVLVTSLGGDGGRGTRGGYGGDGCRCMQRSWQVRRCFRDSEGRERCEYRTYYCYDGQRGRDGMDGRSGMMGRRGKLTLIKSKDELPADIGQYSGKLIDMMNKNFVLSENIWTEKDGALALLAPGSQLDNRYNEFVRRDTYQVHLGWAAKRDLKEFYTEPVSIRIKNGDVALNLPAKMWTIFEKSRNDMAVDFSIVEVIKQAEVEAVTFQMEGAKSSTVARIKNGATFSGLVQNAVGAHIWKDGVFGDSTIFDDFVPATELVADGQDLLVRIGNLKMKDREDALKPGKKIKLKLNITRTMGEYKTAINSGEIKYKIPK